MEGKELLQECVRYFKTNPGFGRVFSKIREKYRSLGKIRGQICLSNLSQQEKNSLSGFFRKDYSRQQQATIKLSDFQKALQRTRFAGLSLEDILKAYYVGEDLLSRKEERQLYLQERERFFQEIILDFAGATAGEWLEEVIASTSNAYSLFLKRYNHNQEKLRRDIYYTAKALNNLPAATGEKRRLALFASAITKNPHAFDRGSELDDLLQYGPMLLTLMNLSKLQRVCSPGGKVFVLENIAVFASILDRLS